MPLDPQLDPHFEEAGRLNNIDPMLLRAMAMGESSGDPNATSPKNAGGLMQIMPETAKQYGIADPYDPVQAIYGGARIMADNLGKAEALKQSGQNINPVAYALKSYFAGEEGPQWGLKTAAYPGYIASRYRDLVGPSGSSQPDQPDGVAQLAAAGRGSPASANVGSTPMSGIGALAAAGNPAARPGAAPQGQPASPDISQLSDSQIFAGIANGSLPMPSPGGTSPQPATGQPGTGQPVLGPAQVIQMLNTAAAAKGGLAAVPGLMSTVEKMLSEGTQFVRQPDGSIGIGTIGGAADAKRGIAAAGKEGSELLQPGSGGVLQNMHGAVEAGAAKAGAEQEAKTRNTIFEQRPGAVPRTGAEIMDASAGGTASQPPGGVPGQGPLYNNPGVGKGEDIAAEQYGKLRDTYSANQGAAQNLKNFLDAASVVGTGKGTELSGTTAAWLKSLNIDPQKLSFADPAEVEKMQKAANQMIVSTVKGISSRPAYADFNFVGQGLVDPEKQPEANRAIAAALLGRMGWENKLFRDWDADRRGPQAGGSYGHFDFPAWADANPTPGFQASAFQSVPPIPQRGVTGQAEAAPQFRDGQTIKNPQTGERRVFRGGQWVPVQ